MSYPIRYCPYCQRPLDIPEEPTIETAIEKEKEIWHPCDMPDNYTDTNDSHTFNTDDLKITVT